MRDVVWNPEAPVALVSEPGLNPGGGNYFTSDIIRTC